MIFRDVTHQVMAEEALTRAFTQGRLEIIDTVLHNIGNAINSVTTGIATVHRMLSGSGWCTTFVPSSTSSGRIRTTGSSTCSTTLRARR